MSKRKEKPAETGAPPIPAWFLTYADTVTLLMTFFVMLMSFSTLDDEKFEKVRGSLKAHLGVVSDLTMSRNSLLMRRNMASSRIFVEGYENPPDFDPISNVRDDFQVRVRATSMANILDYRVTQRGFEIHILAGALFEEGSARIEPNATRALDLVGAACRYIPHPLRVQGFSDGFFIPTESAGTPEELALARATAVCRYLHQVRHIPVPRLSTAAETTAGAAARADAEGKQITIVVQRPTKWKVRL